MEKKVKIFALLLLGLFLISVSAQLVSADALTDGAKKLFSSADSSKIFSDDNKAIFARLLLMALVVMIVFAVTSFLPFVPEDKEYINWIIAIIVGILSFMYVDKTEIQTILTSYKALGITLTSVLPLVILMVFTYRLREKEPVIASMVNPPIIILFTLYGLVQWIYAAVEKESSLAWVYILVAILSGLWFFYERRLSRKVMKLAATASLEGTETILISKLQQEFDQNNQTIPNVSGPQQTALRQRNKQILIALKKHGLDVSMLSIS